MKVMNTLSFVVDVIRLVLNRDSDLLSHAASCSYGPLRWLEYLMHLGLLRSGAKARSSLTIQLIWYTTVLYLQYLYIHI
jgi:hypothetical protein